jgi:predicted HicB family RNase H-like nuclease
MMKPEQAYMKVVEWSNADGCYVGSAPPLIGQCCHGDTEEEVYRQLAVIVPDVLETYSERGFKLPEASAGKEFNGKILARVRPELHRALAIRALMERRSINSYIEAALERAVIESDEKPRRKRLKAL